MVLSRRLSRGSVRWSIDVRAALMAEARGETEILGWRVPSAVLLEEEHLVAGPQAEDAEAGGFR